MRILILASLCICVALAFAAPAMAESITYTLDQHFGEAYAPSGPLTITFDDEGTAGEVIVTMSVDGLTGSNEKVLAWLFNYDDGTGEFDAATDLSIDWDDDARINTIGWTNGQGYQAGGDGNFNIAVDFKNSGTTFGTGDQDVILTITGTDIVASNFSWYSDSTQGGDWGPYYSAAHVGGVYIDDVLQDDGSGWVGAVPEPTSIALLGLGFAGLVALHRRRRRD